MFRFISLRKWAKVASMGVLLIVVAVGAMVWLAGSEPVLRWLAERAVAASGGQLALQGVQGSIYGPMRIAGLVYETDFRRVALRGLEFDWSPRNLLLRRHVQIQPLRLKVLEVSEKKPDEEPLRLPQTLRLPVSMEIPAAIIEQIVVSTGGQRYAFGPLKAKLDNKGDRYHLKAAVDSPWGKAESTLALAASSPFALHGTVTLVESKEPHPYSMTSEVGGKLAAITLSAKGISGLMEGQLQAMITPFEKLPLQQVVIQARHLSPQLFGADLPQADLGIDLTLKSKTPDVFHGALKIVNSLPGTIDHTRLPLREIEGTYEGGLEEMAFNAIRLDMGAAGQLAGKGGLRRKQLHFELSTSTFNLRGMHGKLKSTRLTGTIRLGAQGSAQTLQADLGQQRYHILLDAQHSDATLKIKTARVEAAGSELAFNGTLSLANSRNFRGEGSLRRFNPARFGDYPAASINAAFSAEGRLLPQWQTALKVSIVDSRFRGRPLSGQGTMNVSANRLWGTDLGLRLGSNHLSARGAFGARDDRLDWQLDARDVGALGPQFKGRARALGTFEGTLEEPAGNLEVTAENLNWDNKYRLTRLSGAGRLDKGLDGPLTLIADLQGYRAGGFALDHASLIAKGRRSGHELELAARNKTMDAFAMLAGAWRGDKGWAGEIRRFENRGTYPVVLKRPAKLAAGKQHFSLTDVFLGIAHGTVHIDELVRKDGRLSTRGAMDGVSSADLLRLTAQPLGIEASLTFGGKWSLVAADMVNGEIALWREKGDVTMLTEPRTHLGLSRLAFRVAVTDNRLSGKFDLAGTALGFVSATGESVLRRKGEAWGIAGDAAFTLQADASMPSIAWASPLLGEQMEIDGAVSARFSGSGTIREPHVTGAITGDRVELSYPEQGVYFKDGSLRAVLRENQLIVEHIALRGGEGSLTGNGSMGWESGKPVMKIALLANKLEVLNRPERHLILSGNGEATVRDRNVRAVAKLKADRGLIELPKSDAPILSPDIVVIGRGAKIEKKTMPYTTDIDLDLDLGDQFFFKGKGVDARLAGTIRVRAKNGGLPAASGVIRVAQGSYFAYGQQLSIERGILNFSGPIDNPGLNIVALRKNQPVEAGVSITGTALAPNVRLTSNPSVPDSEKLSWLVLGHGLESSSGAEFSLLQAAAGALLAKGESVTLQSRIAHAAGLDEFALSGAGGLEKTVLTLGKRLSSRTYLTFEQGLAGATNVAKINYTLTKRLSVRAQTGTESAVDLFYTFSFD